MALFSRTKSPTTVDEALAGFATLKQQLIDVVALHIARRNEGQKRIVDAKAYAEEVEKTETAAILAADAEIRRAENAEAMIAKLLGEPDQETLRTEQASAHA